MRNFGKIHNLKAMSEKIPINIVVGDRTYRVKIERKDEELVRKTLHLLNQKVLDFKTSFAGKDMQDYIAMALIWFATEQNLIGNFLIKEKETSQKLNGLENLLDRLLKEDGE